jgi:hypothetical protein
MSTTITATAGTSRPTTTGVEGAVDVPVTLQIAGRTVRGEVTLLPADDGRPVFERWGDADHWVSGDLLRELRELPHHEYRDALTTIEAAASKAAGRPE